jgi:hypothetical protein
VIDGYYMSFPVLQIALFMAVATAGLPYLARGVQRLVEIFIALVALASAVGGHGLPSTCLGSLVIGWGVTAVVRLVFGSPLGLPSAEDVRLLLEEFGIRLEGCAPGDPAGLGGGEFEATELMPGGYARSPRYRGLRPGRGRCQAAHQGGPVPAVPGLRAEPDDYPASAGRARGLRHHASGPGGVAVPEIVEAGTAGPSRDALLVYRMPPGTALSDTTPLRSATPRSMTCTASC